MRIVDLVLRLSGLLMLATIAHELIHVITGRVTAVGVVFGAHGGFFVDTIKPGRETCAYLVEFIVLIIGLIWVMKHESKI